MPMKPAGPLLALLFAAAIAGGADLEVHFSPGGGCTRAITNALAGARRSVNVQAYALTSAPIAGALVAAHQRGVAVKVILDKGQRSDQYSSADFLLHAGIACLIDDAHAIAHNKIIIIDDRTVITGSFNFTRAAEEKNAENLLLIQDRALAAKYAANWKTHAKHSTPYEGNK